MEKAAEVKLDEIELARFRDLLKKFSSIRRERNNVVHGVWAVSEEAPNSLILTNSKSFLILTGATQTDFKPESQELKHFGKLMQDMDTNLEYKERDFVELEARIISLSRKISEWSIEIFRARVKVTMQKYGG
jgi:hypothetical protein